MEGHDLAMEVKGQVEWPLLLPIPLANFSASTGLTMKIKHQFEAPDRKMLLPFGCRFFFLVSSQTNLEQASKQTTTNPTKVSEMFQLQEEWPLHFTRSTG